MATTAERTARIAQLEAVLGSGAEQVRFADGSGTTYRSHEALRAELAQLRAEAASEVSTPRVRVLRCGVTSGLA